MRIGIKGATIIDSNSAGQEVFSTLPLFGGLRNKITMENNQVIFSVLDTETVDDLLNVLAKILDKESDLVFSLPVDNITGLS